MAVKSIWIKTSQVRTLGLHSYVCFPDMTVQVLELFSSGTFVITLTFNDQNESVTKENYYKLIYSLVTFPFPQMKLSQM